ncbi:hypothetical protein KCG34_13880 [Phenylobacterium montanum]|uniref:DUF4129 domain-containing protein n=1 Tax=Phenylobacterium montanum TaxID=2823693 RepID=A0A975G442_9CAUL|nr:hypothetical protein KCG34_13880 [Caulobacter sp. S6]
MDPVARAHAQLLRQTDLQFAFTGPPKLAPPPGWLLAFLRWLKHMGPELKWVFWAGLAFLACLILYLVLREVIGLRWPGRRRKAKPAAAAPDDWRPSAARARTLLEDADRLAAEGRFAEAVHLILFRSIEDIDRRWPRLVQPALTSRDIAQHPTLPEAARTTFAGIARVVERSFFGGQAIGAPEFEACRRDYQAFALPAGA